MAPSGYIDDKPADKLRVAANPRRGTSWVARRSRFGEYACESSIEPLLTGGYISAATTVRDGVVSMRAHWWSTEAVMVTMTNWR